MKYRFTRTRMVAGLAVALTWVGQPAAWADCYDSGFNDGLAQCRGYISQDQCNSQYNGYIPQSSCPVSDAATCKSTHNLIANSECAVLTEGECKSKYKNLIIEDECPAWDVNKCKSEHKELITQSECPISTVDICKSTYTLISSGECSISDEKTCNDQHENLIAKSECPTTECPTIECPVSDEQTCNNTYNNLITQGDCDSKIAEYTGYVDAQGNPQSCLGVAKPAEGADPNSKEVKCASAMETKQGFVGGYNASLGQYTGYVDAQGNPQSCLGVAKPAEGADPNSKEVKCASAMETKQGFVGGYNASLGQYTGYVDAQGNPQSCLGVAKPAEGADPNSKEVKCASAMETKQGFVGGYNASLGQYTGYVDAQGNPQSCLGVAKPAEGADPNSKEVKCASAMETKQGFVGGYNASLGQYTGYVDAQGNPQSCLGVAKPAEGADPNSKEVKCASAMETKQGFVGGYNASLGQYTGYVDAQGNPQSCLGVAKPAEGADPNSKEVKCASAMETKQGFVGGYNASLGQYTGYVDAQGNPQSCLGVAKPAEGADPNSKEVKCASAGAKTGFVEGYNARDKFCEANPQSCIIAYLQGFYNYFAKVRVSENAKASFPDSLTVSSAGGPTASEPADQWRYTWENKTKGCPDLKRGERFKLSGSEVSVCIQQTEDMGEKDPKKTAFGNSEDTSDLKENQSLGYTVYLLDSGNQVKATMEIIFSPNQ